MRLAEQVQAHKQVAFTGAWRYAPAAYMAAYGVARLAPGRFVEALLDGDLAGALKHVIKLGFAELGLAEPFWTASTPDEIFADLHPILLKVSQTSVLGQIKHCAGRGEMGHNRSVSTFHLDSALNHYIKRDEIDPETGDKHLWNAIWRVAVALQIQRERRNGAATAPAAYYPDSQL